MCKVVIVIPFYNHGQFANTLIQSLIKYDLPLIIIDDGSDKEHKKQLNQAIDNHTRDNQLGNQSDIQATIHLLTNKVNLGKGGAVINGFRVAFAKGFTHVLQVDADCQHDFTQIPVFVEAAKNQPETLICGYPEYDESVPKSRLYPRYITHFWVWVNTCSLTIKDSMCGFRCYPLLKTMSIIDSYQIGQRMDFDIEMVVRLHWVKVDITNLPVKVIYHPVSSSHFRVLQDNVLISKTHAKLFFTLLLTKLKLIKQKQVNAR